MASDENQNHDEPVIRDKRRIDPETGEVRQPAADAEGAPAEGAPEADLEATDAAAAEQPTATTRTCSRSTTS